MARSATGLLLFGFAILLAVPPFHLWILPSADTPQVAGRISPAAPAGRISPAAPAGAIWIEMTLHLTGVMLALRFLDSYDWLRQSPELYRAIRLAGIVSTSAGAVAALAMSDPRRSAVYALVSNSGVVLLALGLAQGSGVSLAVMLCALRLPGAALTGSGGRSGEAAADGRSPPLSLGDTYGRLALAGFPLTPEFPARATLLAALAPSDPTAFLVLGGSSLLLTVVALRSVFVGRQGTLPSVGFGKTQMAGVILCISASVLPVPILTGLAAAAAGFVNLSP